MIVLLDIEWLTNERNHISPAQIAALRVTDQWISLDSFYERICPRDSSFYQWDHIAYAGGKSSDFLYAKSEKQVLNEILQWLKPDDILCFWHPASARTFKQCCNIAIKQEITQQICILQEYLLPDLIENGLKVCNPYDIAREQYLKAPTLKHYAKNDVEVMRLILQIFHYKAERLTLPSPQIEDNQVHVKKEMWIEDFKLPFQQEVATGILHMRDCSRIPKDEKLIGFKKLKYSKIKDENYCRACMKNGVAQFYRERNKKIIESTQYRYVYGRGSAVFHRRDCGLILNTKQEIRGCIYFKNAVNSGYRPCKCCNPKPENEGESEKKASRKKEGVSPVKRPLSAEEMRAVERFKRARDERLSRKNDLFANDVERHDFYTLTQPGFAFWAAKGYATFHTRDCVKLRKLSYLVGFSSYNSAIAAGHLPCKYCKPSKKQDMVYSIPITNRDRGEENLTEFAKLCTDAKFRVSQEGSVVNIETPHGKWKLDPGMKPYIIFHRNHRMPTNAEEYHRQPRLFLSLQDVFEYIYRHDCKEDPSE